VSARALGQNISKTVGDRDLVPKDRTNKKLPMANRTNGHVPDDVMTLKAQDRPHVYVINSQNKRL